jgi:serine/threonine-protein kinase TTK/MPS1
VDLAELVIRLRKMKNRENYIRLYWQQILEAVRTVHEEKIVHTDLKPPNFVCIKGQLKLIDFGIAREIQNDSTHAITESSVGSVNYMSPEQLTNTAGHNSDKKEFQVGRHCCCCVCVWVIYL